MSYVSDKADALFQLKADFFPITIIKLIEANLDLIRQELGNTIDKAPNYLLHAPIVIDIRDMNKDQQATLDLKALCRVFKEQKVIPVGIRGLQSPLHEAAIDSGLALMKGRDINLADGQFSSPKQHDEEEKNKTSFAKTITRPVRAGTQIYAKNTDLVITAAVNAGAECLADGNIHVYGPLRGRALAGVNGNRNAHIFCESLEAELIAIAGYYMTKEQLKIPKFDHPLIHVFLKDDKLQIEGI